MITFLRQLAVSLSHLSLCKTGSCRTMRTHDQLASQNELGLSSCYLYFIYNLDIFFVFLYFRPVTF